MTCRTGAAFEEGRLSGRNDFPRKQATNCKLKAAEPDQPEIVLSTCLFDFTRQPRAWHSSRLNILPAALGAGEHNVSNLMTLGLHITEDLRVLSESMNGSVEGD